MRKRAIWRLGGRSQARMMVRSNGGSPARPWALRAHGFARAVVAVMLGIWIGYLLLLIPQLPRLKTNFQLTRMEELAAEDLHYCTKWGFREGSGAYDRCRSDLEEVRKNERERIQGLETMFF